MRRLLLLALLMPVVPGCATGQIAAWLGIPPSKEEYYVKANVKDVWVACRDVLADRGYTFEMADRDEWELRTRWNGYGSDEYYGNKQWQVRLELEELGPRETVIWMSAELQRNSARSPIDPTLDDWESMRSDRNEEEMIHRMVILRLNKNKDHYTETYRRLNDEDEAARNPRDPVNYEEDGKKNK